VIIKYPASSDDARKFLEVLAFAIERPSQARLPALLGTQEENKAKWIGATEIVLFAGVVIAIAATAVGVRGIYIFVMMTGLFVLLLLKTVAEYFR